MFTNFKRVLHFALTDLARNKGISIANIFILVVTISLFTMLFFMHGLSNEIIYQMQNKINITAYFKSDTSEQDILLAKEQILKQTNDIKSIQYVSKEDAADIFLEKYKNNDAFTDALAEVGDNPFLPSLNITTTGEPQQYEKVNIILQSEQFSDLIDQVDYPQKKNIIEKVFSITSTVNKFGIGLAVLFILISIMVVFNTIKLAIDSSKNEISTMRIVGASSWFVRAPFIIQGVIFGLISFIVCFFITMILIFFLSSKLQVTLAGFSLWHYLLSNIFVIILIQFGFGILLGGIASFVVVQKYLKV